MTGKPLSSAFSVGMHIVQLIVIIGGGIVAFMNLKGDVRLIDERVMSVQQDVDKITDYLGIWDRRARR